MVQSDQDEKSQDFLERIKAEAKTVDGKQQLGVKGGKLILNMQQARKDGMDLGNQLLNSLDSNMLDPEFRQVIDNKATPSKKLRQTQKNLK